MPLHGSCLCGTVRYEADQLDAPIVHCHCTMCRKAHAAAFNSSAAVDRAHFRWTAGEDKLSRYASSPDKNRWFCSALRLAAHRRVPGSISRPPAGRDVGRRSRRAADHAHLDLRARARG